MKRTIKKIFKELGYKVEKFNGVENDFVKNSFAQYGEDIIIKNIFSLKGINNPFYLDIGAHHPFFLSNTALFYLKGARGINIEANPELISEFFKKRPEDTNLNIGIGDKEEDREFFIYNDTTLSTFSKDEQKKYDDIFSNTKNIKYKLKEVKVVKVLPLQQVIIENKITNIDLLSIDVEGLDYEILNSIGFVKNLIPKVICIEASEHSEKGKGQKKNDLISLLEGKGYYEYAFTGLNAIMVREEFWFKD